MEHEIHAAVDSSLQSFPLRHPSARNLHAVVTAWQGNNGCYTMFSVSSNACLFASGPIFFHFNIPILYQQLISVFCYKGQHAGLLKYICLIKSNLQTHLTTCVLF
jgi:hypothetical protein